MVLASFETECDEDLEIRLRCFDDACGLELHVLRERERPNLWYSSYLNRLCIELPWFAILLDLPRFMVSEHLADSGLQKKIARITAPLLDRADFDLRPDQEA